MAPSSSVLKVAYGADADAVLGGNFPVETRVASNGQYASLSQFGRPMLLASIGRPVRYAVNLIVALGVPAKIRSRVVLWVAVVVATHEAIWPRAQKGRGNNCCGPSVNSLLPPRKTEVNTPRDGVRFFPQNVACFDISHSAAIRNFIARLVSDDGNPAFVVLLWGHTQAIAISTGKV